MGKWTNQIILKKKGTNGQKTYELFKILGHKGNASQNYIEILPHASQNDYHQ
jgi:hypothetical protein